MLHPAEHLLVLELEWYTMSTTDPNGRQRFEKKLMPKPQQFEQIMSQVPMVDPKYIRSFYKVMGLKRV